MLFITEGKDSGNLILKIKPTIYFNLEDIYSCSMSQAWFCAWCREHDIKMVIHIVASINLMKFQIRKIHLIYES